MTGMSANSIEADFASYLNQNPEAVWCAIAVMVLVALFYPQPKP